MPEQTLIMSGDIDALKQFIKQNDGDVLISTDGMTFNVFYASYEGANTEIDEDADYCFSRYMNDCHLDDVVGWCQIPAVEVLGSTRGKYELTDECKMVDNLPVCRIRATRNIGLHHVKKGDLGGYVQTEANLSHEGSCWVGGDAVVMERARVTDDALVDNQALVGGKAQVYKQAKVTANAQVCGQGIIRDEAVIYGHARISGSGSVSGKAMVGGKAQVYGMAIIKDAAMVRGDAVVCSSATIGGKVRVVLDAKISKHVTFEGDERLGKGVVV